MLSALFSAKRHNEEGFTLLELLIVVIVIGILAAIALPVFLNQQKAARDAAVMSDVRNTAAQVIGWVALHSNDAPSPKAALGEDGKATDQIGNYVASGGKMTLTDGDTVQVVLRADNTYTVSGYRTDGDSAKYNDPARAFSVDSQTGQFKLGAVSETGIGQIYGDVSSISANGKASIFGEASSLSADGLYLGSGIFSGSADGDDSPLDINHAIFDGVSAATDLPADGYFSDTATDVKVYNAKGQQVPLSFSNCVADANYLSPALLVNYGIVDESARPDKNLASFDLNCSSTNPVGGSTTGGTKAIADSLKGGYFTFSTPSRGADRFDITGPVKFIS